MSDNNEGQFANFWAKVEKLPNGCWAWRGKLKAGRGRLSVGKRVVSAHRFAWILVNGPIPEGYDLRKSDTAECEEYCVNPEHRALVKVSRAQTGRRTERMCCPLCGK